MTDEEADVPGIEFLIQIQRRMNADNAAEAVGRLEARLREHVREYVAKRRDRDRGRRGLPEKP